MATYTTLLLLAVIGWNAVSPMPCLCGARFFAKVDTAQPTDCPFCRSSKSTKPSAPGKRCSCADARTIAARTERAVLHQDAGAESDDLRHTVGIGGWQRKLRDEQILTLPVCPSAFHQVDSSESLSISFCQFNI